MVHSEHNEGEPRNFFFFCCRSKESEQRPIGRISRLSGASGSNILRNTAPATFNAENPISNAQSLILNPPSRPKKKELGLSIEELSWAVESPSKKTLVHPETLHTLHEEENPGFVISITSEDLNHTHEKAAILEKKTSLAGVEDDEKEKQFKYLEDSPYYQHSIEPSESDSQNPRKTNRDRLDSDLSEINQPAEVRLAEAELDVDTRLDHAMVIRSSQEF